MSELVVNDQQAQVISQATTGLVVRDESGTVLGYISPARTGEEGDFTEEEIQEALRRRGSNGPWYTTKQVLDHLHSLEQ